MAALGHGVDMVINGMVSQDGATGSSTAVRLGVILLTPVTHFLADICVCDIVIERLQALQRSAFFGFLKPLAIFERELRIQ